MSSTEPESTGDGPTEEEVREYVDKLRVAPAQQILAEMLYNALNAAQIKLGRRDARLFIDFSALMLERLRDYLPADIVTQVEQAVGQLRMAQVQAEAELASGEPEANDLDRLPTGIVAGDDDSAPTPSQQPSDGSKLWVRGGDA